MSTNEFVAKLKATGTEKQLCDLAKYLEEYRGLLKTINIKERGSLSLNILCILIRNLDTVPAWRTSISFKVLLELSVECVRHTRSLQQPLLVKSLGCVYRLHKHVVNEKSPIPPELVLKLSYMSFEYDDGSLLNEYYKTYAYIIIDRVTYIDKLKSKLKILKLLPKLIEDITKTIKIYDTVQFCTDMLTFIIKKISYVFNDWPAEVNDSIGKIFECIACSDMKQFKNLSEKQAIDLFVKFNECLLTVTENSLRINCKNPILDSVTRVCVSILGHIPDMFHCFQTIFLNSFCCIFNDKTNPTLIDNLLKNILTSCEMTEKLGYKSTIYATYPFISQCLRLYIEYCVNNEKSDHINEETQASCFNLVIFLMEKLKTTKQLSKCENCNIKTGLHDALRVALTVKHIVIMSLNKNIDSKTNLPLYLTIVEHQYVVLEELNKLKCPNQERCFRKLQIDINNLAVMLNKHKHYEHSIKLFDIYLKYELKYLKSDADFKNISRALYNKGICELDAKDYKKSLINAYLSLVFSLPDGLESEKYMSLVIDVKSKALQSVTEGSSDKITDMQAMSILEACNLVYEDEDYGHFKMYLKNLNFCSLLKHEFSMYTKLWASAVPLAGVCTALLEMSARKPTWIKAEPTESVLGALYEAVLEAPAAVRSVHCQRLRDVVWRLADILQRAELSVAEQVVHGGVLLLKAEYELSEAADRFAWKMTDHTSNPFQEGARRTAQQEYDATRSALRGAELLARAVLEFEPGMLSSSVLQRVVQLVCVSVEHLLLLHWFAHAALLAIAGCQLAQRAGDKLSYMLCASTLVYHSERQPRVDVTVTTAVTYAAECLTDGQHLDAALCLLCDVAMYYTRSGRLAVAGRLLQTVQRRLLTACENQRDDTLQLSAGRLLAAQAQLCGGAGLSALGAANCLQRHYLAALHTAGSSWSARRRTALHVKRCIAASGARGAGAARRLALWRRAAAAAAAALPAAGAAARALLRAAALNAHDPDAQTQLSLWLEPATPRREDIAHQTERKTQLFSPTHNVELMLDGMHARTHSPHPPPAHFRTPGCLRHAAPCACHACVSPAGVLLACRLAALQASAYFRAAEFRTARDHFAGVQTVLRLAEDKLKHIFCDYRAKQFDDVAVGIAEKMSYDEFKTIQLEFLIELSFFELSQREFENADDCIVNIHEMLAESTNVDPYLKHDVSNLLVAYANLKRTKVIKETGLELDMEELKLSPRLLKTPESKPIPKVCETNKIVDKEELPKKFKLLAPPNFDEEDDDDAENVKDGVPKKKPTNFKIPVPATSKPVLENFTPRPTRSRPKILISQPSADVFSTPKTIPDLEFSTPCQTPAEFFTPMTSIKTYTKRNIVAKNLENEFSTPKVKNSKKDIEELSTEPAKALKAPESGRRTRSKVESGTIKGLSDKKALKRATSPGKLVDEKVTRARNSK
ncbi:uncharacterized protein LOC112045697 [Bicyclus anynana]|uniref:Uncharacterized protein LOC112045697 n=1 Tax=Bicyclus anynana TaxID=110368 RepID=A0ABM3M2S4_BICAN|nr:uncharacterized protein LOC112045697 [Bicyclus anynana]